MDLAEALRAEIDEWVRRLPERRAALLPALHLVQREQGFVSLAAMREIAQQLGLRPVDVLEVVSFDDALRTEPPARHRVGVCTSLSCALRGGRTLLAQLEGELGIAAGTTTEGGAIGLERTTCLGVCAAAPVVRIDGTDHGGVDAARARELLGGLG